MKPFKIAKKVEIIIKDIKMLVLKYWHLRPDFEGELYMQIKKMQTQYVDVN